MATKECNHDSDIMLYQYLYDICNSTISYDFITTVDVMFPTPAPPVPVPCAPVACTPVPCTPRTLKTTGNAVSYSCSRYSSYSNSKSLSDYECNQACRIV